MAGDARAKELLDLGDRLYTRRDPMLTLWQEIADNFYVERGNFTREFTTGEEFADHVTDGFCHLMRRELGNSISAMLRPRERPWFGLTTSDPDRDREPENAAYMEYVTAKMKRALYDPRAKFIDATKGSDHDFVTFGQACMSVEDYRDDGHLFFRQHHLRDLAWLDNAKNDITELHRKDRMSARQMKQTFKEENLARPVKEACKKDPGAEFNVRHVCMPIEDYDYLEGSKKTNRRGKRLKYVSIYIDADNCKILKEGAYLDFPYIIPRWHKVSGMSYAFSPATTIALPDARMMQQMARIILEAGEKAVDPPLVASGENIREANLAAGAITWADALADGDVRKAVMPIAIENNMQVAFAMRQDMREMMTKAWFVEKLTLPPVAGSDQMTAEEVRIRQDEFIRNLLPLFEPMEIEYNTKLLDKSYALMREMGAFNDDEVPEDLAGADVSWQFESPLQVATRRQLTSQFTEVINLIGLYAQIAPMAEQMPIPVDLTKGLKDAIYGIGSPSDWSKSNQAMAEEAQAKADQAEQMQQMQAIQGGALVAQDVADASMKVGEAMQPPVPQMVGKPVQQKQIAGPSKSPAKKKEAA